MSGARRILAALAGLWLLNGCALAGGAVCDGYVAAQETASFAQEGELARDADSTEAAIGEAARAQLDELDMSGLQSAAERLAGDSVTDVRELVEQLRAGKGLDAEAFMRGILALAGRLLRRRVPLVIALITCAVLSGMAERLCGEGGGRVSGMICLCAAAGLVVGDVAELARSAREALAAMGMVLDALLPLIAGVLASMGAHISAGLMGGVLTAVAGAGMRFGREYVIGLALVSASLEVCAGLNPRLKLSRASELMRSLCGLMVGGALVVTLGAITVNGSLSASVDGVSVRAARYALDNLVPVVGGEIKDTVGVMAASCLMVQSLLGSCGMLLMLLGAARPVTTLAAAYISYKACAAAAQALGGEQLGSLSEGMAKVVRTLMVAVLGVAAIIIMLLGAMGTAARALLAG